MLVYQRVELHNHNLQSDLPFFVHSLYLCLEIRFLTQSFKNSCMYLFKTIADASNMCGPSIFFQKKSCHEKKNKQTNRCCNHIGTEQHGGSCHCSVGALRRSGEVKHGILGFKKCCFSDFVGADKWDLFVARLSGSIVSGIFLFTVFSHMLNCST